VSVSRPWMLAFVSFCALRMIPVAQSHLGAWRFTTLVAREQPPPDWYWTEGASKLR
jgi:hypothetical protein